MAISFTNSFQKNIPEHQFGSNISLNKLEQDLGWLYVDFNSYFASVEQQLNPSLRGKPIAIVAVQTDATSAIAASYEAKAYGIKTGTRIYDAKKVCPNLICVLAQHEKYVEFHHNIIAEINKHIPITVVGSIDEVGCRLMLNECSVEQATIIAHSIKKGLAKNIGEFVKCSIGVAPNKYLAKIATDINKPDGLTFIKRAEIYEKISPLKLTDLPGIGHNMQIRLNNAGIKTIADLWALDAKQLRKVWGSIWGERIWYLLRGYEIAEEQTTKRTIGHSHVMSPEIRTPEKAKYVARRLVLKAASRLRRFGLCANGLHFSTRLESGLRLEGYLRCIAASDSITFVELLDEIWKNLEPKFNRQRLKKVSVTLFGLSEPANVQQNYQTDLFAKLPPEIELKRRKQECLSKAIDKINYKYGRDSVLFGMMPNQGRSFTGTKIAFTRIPDLAEFLE